MLSLANVDTYRGARQVLRGISIEVGDGEVVALIGPNGAGKTTTLKTISGLLRPRAGSVRFDGQDLSALSPARVVQLGVVQVPEGRLLFPEMTVQENLEMGAATRRDRAGIDADFERVFTLFPILKERRRQLAATLSGGQQQMLAIGRGLMARPRLFLLDEPSLGLSPILVEQIATIIRDIHTQGTTVLLVEQNAALALSLASRAYVLENGAIALSGTSPSLLANPAVRESYLGV